MAGYRKTVKADPLDEINPAYGRAVDATNTIIKSSVAEIETAIQKINDATESLLKFSGMDEHAAARIASNLDSVYENRDNLLDTLAYLSDAFLKA